MTHHESFPTEAEADAAFERLLLRSASADQLPEGATREAWAKFVSTSVGMGLLASPAPDASAMLRAARRASLKWLAVGALGGSALTAAWLGSHTASESARMAPPNLPSEPAAAVATPLPMGDAQRAPSQSAAPTATQEGDSRPSHRRSPLSKQTTARPTPAPKPSDATEGTASSLAAEVAALDAVQKAFANHDFPRAVRLVDEYEREFPRGQLAPDADALAIEALAARGSRAELERRAERFLSRYPNDPHRARIATLLDPSR